MTAQKPEPRTVKNNGLGSHSQRAAENNRLKKHSQEAESRANQGKFPDPGAWGPGHTRLAGFWNFCRPTSVCPNLHLSGGSLCRSYHVLVLPLTVYYNLPFQ